MQAQILAKSDIEWASDWEKIVSIYDAIDNIEQAFAGLSKSVSYLRDLTQQQLLINLKKYAWSLQNLIIQKYKD